MTRPLSILICLLISCATFAGGNVGTPKQGTSLFDRWANNETLSIELHINMDSLEANRYQADYLPAQVVAAGETLDLKVSVRGRFRRRTCEVPPLKLKFAKQGLRALGLNTHNDFKLVTHCTGGKDGREAILREQLAYELYRTIDPTASFRTQVLDITYVDEVTGERTSSVAILIEDYDELQDRLQLVGCKDCYNQPAATFTNAERVTLFQYMIGNGDFCPKTLRNVKLLRDTTSGTITAIPYDFDFSGIVDASYAMPNYHLGEQHITDRTLTWTLDGEADYTEAISYFQSKEDTLLTQVADFAELSKKSKKDVSKYLAEFFEAIADDSFTTAE